MGGTAYSSVNAENTRSVNNTYVNTIDQNFTQNVEKKSHSSMRSQGITLRESRDSDVHPNSFPIIIALDLTASMGMIPQNLIQEGLPKMISHILQGGVQSPAVLFLGVGDHEVDKEPLQIGQFESGDEELDKWLSRTYLERGGGGNEGESYGLAHYFAGFHCKTDHWDKRGQKGVLVTIGDEPNLKTYPGRAMKHIMAIDDIPGASDAELLQAAQDKWEVFHINPKADLPQIAWRDTHGYWESFLGDNYLKTGDYKEVPTMIADTVLKVALSQSPQDPSNDVIEVETPGSENTQKYK